MSQSARKEYMQQMKRRYRRAGKRYKTLLLNEVCEVCGYERKYAGRVLADQVKPPPARRGRKRFYAEEELLRVLKTIWLASGQLCGKRLQPALALWLRDYPRHHGPVSAPVRAKLLDISAATVDRLLKPLKARYTRHRNRGTKPGSLLKTQVPLRTGNEDIQQPGYVEADTVAHGGESLSGSFIWSLTLTDIHTGWTSMGATWNRGYAGIKTLIEEMEARLPFPLLGFDSDNGGEFLNHHLLHYFKDRERPLGFTRSRSYHKNDNAHVEQKNWTHVRQLLGYDRLDHPALLAPINRLYRLCEQHHNFFCPSMKLISKERHGSQYRKTYDQARTPYQRLLESTLLSVEQAQAFQAHYASLDPYALKRQMEKTLRLIQRLKKQPVRSPEPPGVLATSSL